MLPTEGVTRPTGSPIAVLWHTDNVYLMLGRKWQEVYIRLVALYLATTQDIPGCVIWNEIQGSDQKRHCFYIVPEEPERLDSLVMLLRSHIFPTGVDTVSAVPHSALPVLKRYSDGRLLRLWPSPPPKVPRRQTLKFDWTSIQVHNAVADIRSTADG